MSDGKTIPISIKTSADTAGAKAAALSIDELKKVVKVLEVDLQGLRQGTEAYDESITDLARAKLQLKEHYSRVNAEVKKLQVEHVNTGRSLSSLEAHYSRVNSELKKSQVETDKAAGSTRNIAQSTLLFSQGLEDAQYGIRGVLNNIPGLVMSLGGGAGLAGVISIAAVGISLLTEHFDLFGKKTKEVSEAEKQALVDHRQYAKEAAVAAAQRAEELGHKEVEETLQNQNDLLEIGLNFMRDQTAEARARRDAEERILKAQDELELARIDDAVSAGSLTEQQANSRRAGVRYGAQERAREGEVKQAQESAAVALREQEAATASFTEKDSVSRQAQNELAMRRAEMEEAKRGVKGAIAGDHYRKAQEEYQNVRDSEFSTAGDEQRAMNKRDATEVRAAEYGPAANLTFEKAKPKAEKAEAAFLEAEARAKEAATAVAAQQKAVATATRNARAAQSTEQVTTETVQSESAIAAEIKATVQQTAAREAEKKKREEDLRRQKELEKANQPVKDPTEQQASIGRAAVSLLPANVKEDFRRSVMAAAAGLQDGDQGGEIEELTRLMNQLVNAVQVRGTKTEVTIRHLAERIKQLEQK